MQKIDVFTITSDERENKQFNLIELKCVPAYPEITYQLQRYADWTVSYIKCAINSNGTCQEFCVIAYKFSCFFSISSHSKVCKKRLCSFWIHPLNRGSGLLHRLLWSPLRKINHLA